VLLWGWKVNIKPLRPLFPKPSAKPCAIVPKVSPLLASSPVPMPCWGGAGLLGYAFIVLQMRCLWPDVLCLLVSLGHRTRGLQYVGRLLSDPLGQRGEPCRMKKWGLEKGSDGESRWRTWLEPSSKQRMPIVQTSVWTWSLHWQTYVHGSLLSQNRCWLLSLVKINRTLC